jgi:hypothetical protein
MRIDLLRSMERTIRSAGVVASAALLLTGRAFPSDNFATAGPWAGDFLHHWRTADPATTGRLRTMQTARRTTMSFWTDLSVPTEQELLVGFYDLRGYMRYAETAEPRQLLDLMTGYFALTGEIIQEAGGRLIKTLGDAGLAAFPAELADPAVRALQSLRAKGRDWLAERGYRSQVVVKLHLGPVAVGRVGAPGQEILDVYGQTVNIAAALPSSGLALTPAAFRGLQPETRKLFKKHTPPITYIDAADPRPD